MVPRLIGPRGGAHHAVVALPRASWQPAEPLAVEVVQSHVPIVQRDGDDAGAGDGQAVDGGVDVDARQGAPHIPEVPDPDAAVVGTGDDLTADDIKLFLLFTFRQNKLECLSRKY